jgi:hypothetical protein
LPGQLADEITQVEVGNDADPGRIRRIAAALGIPEDAVFQETAAEPRQAAE